MNAEIVDQAGTVFIGRQADGQHVLYDENGDSVPYEKAPPIAKARYDRLELKRQGQLEMEFFG